MTEEKLLDILITAEYLILDALFDDMLEDYGDPIK